MNSSLYCDEKELPNDEESLRLGFIKKEPMDLKGKQTKRNFILILLVWASVPPCKVFNFVFTKTFIEQLKDGVRKGSAGKLLENSIVSTNDVTNAFMWKISAILRFNF